MQAIFDQGLPPPCPAPFNLAAYCLAMADRQPGKLALSIIGGSVSDNWNYGALKAAVLGIGAGLLREGLKPGDIVLLRLGNTVDFPLAYLGAIAVGLTPVPTSAQLTKDDVAKMIKSLRPALILRGPEIDCPDDAGVPVLDTARLRMMRHLPAAEFAMGDPDRLAYIVYTSGTSGLPRAVMHAHRAIWARRMMHEDWYDLRPDDRVLHAGAFNWTYTLGTGLMDPWSIGATALIPAEAVAPDRLPDLLKTHAATIFAAAPGVYRKFLREEAVYDLPALRHGLSAGEKMPQALLDRWHRATGRTIYEAFGLSECSTFISSNARHPAQNGAVGRPQTGRRVAIIGSNGPVSMGEEGTISIDANDPGLMLGYLDAKEETAERFRHGWFLTGDQGRMDADGQITYLGRSDDMMNAGGYRLSPLEVESALLAHPALREVGVTDVEIKPDVRVIAAFYTAKTPLEEADLVAFAKQHLARYKQPRLYIHLEALPLSGNGKIRRSALRQLYEARNG